jgi:hypothetical protein
VLAWPRSLKVPPDFFTAPHSHSCLSLTVAKEIRFVPVVFPLTMCTVWVRWCWVIA